LPSADAVKTLTNAFSRSGLNLEGELGVAIVQALGRQVEGRGKNNAGAKPAAEALHGLVLKPGDGVPLSMREAAVGALAGSRAGAEWLLDQHAKKELPEALTNSAAIALRNSPYLDLRNKAMLAFPPPGKLDPKKLPSIPTLAARKGDAGRGKQLMAASANNNMQCLKCHTVRGVGGQVGPDLSVIGKKASRENLIESILYPSKAIADQYVSWKVETKQGLAVVGLLVEDSPTTLTLRDANGKDTKIDKKDIDTREKSLVSLMPADIVVAMSEDELIDVVEYMFSLKTPVLGLDYWRIAGPFDNGQNDAGLDQVFPPEKAVDLSATYDGKLGKVNWRTVKPDATGYVDLKAFFDPNSQEIVSYLYREIDSAADQEATVCLGTDDCAKLWVSGELVYTSREHRAAAPDQDAVKVKLKKGKNPLLLKINNGGGPHGFYLTIGAEQELKRVEEK
jgi:putative heme-binding domain-containing protein